jgi:two-component system LytT family response regulator
MRLRALLVDDEESALRWLGDLLSLQPEIEVVGTATSVMEAAALLVPLRPDVVFLDISMPRQSGMEFFASAHAGLRIVLVTAHDDRALEAFDAGAFDYVLKPVTAARLGKTIDRLRHTSEKAVVAPPASDKGERISVNTSAGTMLLPYDEVLWIEARQNYSLIRRCDGTALLVKTLLGDLGEGFPSRRFARIGRSLVINLESLRAIDRYPGNGALLRFAGSSETLVIGRAATSRLRQFVDSRQGPEFPPR